MSFRQNKMFDIFAGKVRSFKELFLLVKPRSEAALDKLLKTARSLMRLVARPRPVFPSSPCAGAKNNMTMNRKILVVIMPG